MSADDGQTYTEIDEDAINNKPFLRGHVVTQLSNLGSVYLFKLVARNELGSSESLPKAIVLASPPDRPDNPPE